MDPKPVDRPQTYERDARWTQVDRYAREKLDHGNPYAAALQYASEQSVKEGLPNIEVSPMQGKFLALQCQLVAARHVLEVGTLGGYSAIWLAQADPRLDVTTVEIDAHHRDVAARAIEHAGLSERVHVLLGAGADVLPRIRAEVDSGRRPRFDLVFIDADKQNNLLYLDEALQMCRSRACVIVDNVVRKGQLADDEMAKTDARVQGAREVVEAAGKDDRILGTTLIQTVGEKNYDGFLMCVVK